ncbi:curli biogenesis system outer membrane secretion channel CsgG [Variovorax sp. SG517]|uniref:CsgG/HfaB family protein n=1 Tax=Variovorax sp. SG517 TaxID=2587117 RepID=UPI00159D1F5D|nr:CsgG/HfaB family protein [Variovorax sp. SG517]NVM92531.1 curli biogenesis system outer membrane secretion channel CsgG [Variovorax sp. SG517]
MQHRIRRTFVLAAAVATLALAGCVSAPQQRFAPNEAPVVLGPAVRDNVTPMEAVLACYADHIAATRRPPVIIGVGDVKDYTGKYSINEGNAITQGGALMVYSALGKLGGAVSIAERFDPVIAERELAYADRRQLGDGRTHQLGGPNGGQNVPWLPYFGGTINKSDYFIVGGITELNYNINSGGAEFGVNQVGVKARTFSQSVSIDLRIVDTKSLMVVRTVSLTKQFNGYEVGLNVFRFFGSKLYDVDIGAKGQEPVQMGVRAALEEGVVRLMAAVTQVDHRPCMTMRPGGGEPIPLTPAAELRKVDNPGEAAVGGAAVTSPVAQGSVAVNAGGAGGARLTGTATQVPFDFGATTLGGASLALIDQIAGAAKKGTTDIVLVARDTENWDARKRDELTDQRIAAVTSALANRGVAPGAISITWRPDAADTSIHRDGPGLQEIAKLRVGSPVVGGAAPSSSSDSAVKGD